MVGVNLAGVGDWAIGSSRAGLSLATRLTAVEISQGFEAILARRRGQPSGGHRVHIDAVELEVEGLQRQDHRRAVADGDAAHKAEGKRFSLTFRIYVAKEAAEMRVDAAAMEKVN
jgi:hypothetical protein